MATVYASTTGKGIDRDYRGDITGITRTNPCEITFSSSAIFNTGDKIFITGVNGMSQINNLYLTVLTNHGTHIDVDLDTTSGFSTYSSGGLARSYEKVVQNITNSNAPEVFCENHGFNPGEWFSFARIEGMTVIDDKVYQVGTTASNKFSVVGLDTTSLGTFTSGFVIPVIESTYLHNVQTGNEISFLQFTQYDFGLEKTPDATLHELGNVTFTAKSNTIQTDADYSSVFSVGDLIGKPTAAGNGNHETFYRVASVSANSITLAQYYGGETEVVSGLKRQYPQPVNVYSGYVRILYTANHGSLFKGGYDFLSNEYNGETWLSNGNGETNVSYSGIYSTSTSQGVVFENINTHLVHSNFFGSPNAVVRNCTFLSYAANGQNSSNSAAYFENVAFPGSTQTNQNTFSIANPISFKNCFFNTTDQASIPSIRFSGLNTYYQEVDFDGSVFSGGEGIEMYVYTVIRNAKFKNCVTGVSQTNRGATVINCEFMNCDLGVEATVFKSCNILDCSFDQCLTGVSLNAPGNRIENCDFSNNNVDIVNGNDSSDTLLVNNRHITPLSSALSLQNEGGKVTAVSCSIDPASQNKAFNIPTSPATNFPCLALQNSFGYTGQFYAGFEILKDSTTLPASIQTKFNTGEVKVVNDFKIASTYTKQSIGKILNITLRAVSSGWAGSLIPRVRLNEVLIFTGDEITSIPDDSDTDLSLSIPGGLLVEDGELSINFLANCNSISINVSKFEVQDV